MDDLIHKLPKKLFVGLYEFKFVLKEPGSEELRVKPEDNDSEKNAQEDTIADGVTDLSARLVYISTGLTLKRLVNVVIHECTHCINWSQDIEDGASEEDFTQKYADGFTQFWLDNPRLMRWLSRAFNEIRKQQDGPEQVSHQ